jgi:spoIIIJ-associated protein
VSQGESAVTEAQVSAAQEAGDGLAPGEAALTEADPGDSDGAQAEAGLEDADGLEDAEDLEDVEDAEDADAEDADEEDEDLGSAQADSAQHDVADLEAEGEIAADYIEGLLDVADLDGDIDMDVEGDRAVVSVVGATLDELVGSRGEVLEALQELTRLAVHRQTGARTRIMIDIGGYRLRRRSELAETGRDAADEVKRTGEPKKLWPMNPFERKIVHDAVAAAGLRSESEGEEPDRRVVVLPAS